ncbi:MAG: transketolase [Thermoleophilaceae bacterium]|nr:transketolase [Thermoleophilaceae bacterium]
MSDLTPEAIEKLSIDTIRTLSMDGVQRANSGHPGTPMALAPITYTLFTKVMRHSPHNPLWPARDRFILSAGHASMLLYSTLHLTGYGVSLEDLENFRQLGSPTAGHPEYGHAPGIEMTTGPLGQGIAHAVGFALAERLLHSRFATDDFDPVGHYTYVIASDGDIEEGISSEAGSLAGHLGLGRLIAFYDANHISIEGDTNLALSEDTAKRYEAYGWQVIRQGEDIAVGDIEGAIEAAKAEPNKPTLIIVRTHIAFGSPNKVDTEGAHGAPLGDEEIKLTKEAYGFPSLEPFFVPPEVSEHYSTVAEHGDLAFKEWEGNFDAYRANHPELAAEFDRLQVGELPDGWDAEIPTFSPDDKPVATRKASEAVIQWAAKQVPELVGGSADLAPSNLTLMADAGSVQAGDWGGRNLHFGIREHAMGAAVNGLTLSGLRGYGATFLIFSDYMKPAMRLAALMGIPSIYVFTHDSIGLGEDGPTHQPVEQLWSLRATPNIDVIRPADANETALGWAHALRANDRPSMFALSRQNLPILGNVPADAIEKGAWVVKDTEGTPDLIIIATGSEVSIALDGAKLLDDAGVSTRVVSAPCLERFNEQPQDYKDSVLLPDVRARLSIEAGSTVGWHRYVGDAGYSIGMESFGASGPQPALYEHFGFTPEKVLEHGKRVAEAAPTPGSVQPELA